MGREVSLFLLTRGAHAAPTTRAGEREARRALGDAARAGASQESTRGIVTTSPRRLCALAKPNAGGREGRRVVFAAGGRQKFFSKKI